jgi:hypothetical protein
MEAEIPLKVVEDLLTSFISGALGMDMHERIHQYKRLPTWHRQKLESLLKENVTWLSWTTALGIIVAAGRYDLKPSVTPGWKYATVTAREFTMTGH